MPPQTINFLHPLKVINHYNSCLYQSLNGKLESLKHGCVWKFIADDNLNGTHDSLIDYKVQTDIVILTYFFPFIKQSESIQPLDNIFSRIQQSAMAKKLESQQELHKPWFKLEEGDNFLWTP